MRTPRPTHALAAILAGAALILAGCAGDDEADMDADLPVLEETGAEDPSGQADVQGDMARTEIPDTTESALRDHLEEENYRDTWRLWPGTDSLYSGTEPHGMLLTTYVNDAAYPALQDGTVDDVPHGAIIVKNNFNPDSTFASSTVMMKVDGYNPDHANWLFAKYAADGSVEAFGRAAACQECHMEAASGYLYTASGN